MDYSSIIKRQFSRLRLYLAALFLLALLVEVAIFVGLIAGTWDEPFPEWLPELVIGSLTLLATGLLALVAASVTKGRLRQSLLQTIDRETRQLRLAAKQIRSIQAMTKTLSATTSAETVMEVTLDTCLAILGDLGLSEEQRRGAIYLLENDRLVPIASDRLIDRDFETSLGAEDGVILQAFEEDNPTISHSPADDPELQAIMAFRESRTAICAPLRANYQIFGIILLATSVPVSMSQEELAVLDAIADQAVVALQNALKYQELVDDKRQIVAADEDTRRVINSSLYEGPKQNVDTIAMRLSFIRSTVVGKPEEAEKELRKVEALARKTSQDIQKVLSALRPVEMEAQSLRSSIVTLSDKLQESNGLKLSYKGLENSNLLNEEAQAITYFVVEEAVNSAHQYARANTIEISLWPQGKWFMARVADNGTGRDLIDRQTQKRSPERLGLTSMQQRARQLDGTLDVAFEPGRGSTVTLAVPLDKHGRSAVPVS